MSNKTKIVFAVILLAGAFFLFARQMFGKELPEEAQTVAVADGESTEARNFIAHLSELARSNDKKTLAKLCHYKPDVNFDAYCEQLRSFNSEELTFLGVNANKTAPEIRNVYFRTKTGERLHFSLYVGTPPGKPQLIACYQYKK